MTLTLALCDSLNEQMKIIEIAMKFCIDITVDLKYFLMAAVAARVTT